RRIQPMASINVSALAIASSGAFMLSPTNLREFELAKLITPTRRLVSATARKGLVRAMCGGVLSQVAKNAGKTPQE
ncbi:MAG: hypothetical protein MUC83_07015, partial [Pirellula sp.]|nr:hypothetical protein [Pirellula sp.]